MPTLGQDVTSQHAINEPDPCLCASMNQPSELKKLMYPQTWSSYITEHAWLVWQEGGVSLSPSY